MASVAIRPLLAGYGAKIPAPKHSLAAFGHSTGMSLLWLPAAWIVRRIDIGQLKWAYQVHLNRRTCFRPGEVIHVRRRDGITARLEVVAFCLIELVTHTN